MDNPKMDNEKMELEPNSKIVLRELPKMEMWYPRMRYEKIIPIERANIKDG